MTDSPLITAQALQERLGAPDLRVVDASWFLPAEGRSGRSEYEAERRPGAVYFDIDAISDPETDLPHMLPTPEAFASAAGALGLSREAEIVVYDSFGVRSAARAWWTLRVMGYRRVQVLDGGIRAWRAAGLPLETGPHPVPPAVEVSPEAQSERVRSQSEVASALETG